MKTKVSKKIKLGIAYMNPSYDKSLPIRARLWDFLGGYHLEMNGVVAHDPFINDETKTPQRCDYETKERLIEFIEGIINE